jgi:peptide/nickel transport system permease protein
MNRRQSKGARLVRRVALRIWRMRRAFVLSVPYFLLLGWLYSGGVEGDLRPGELYGAREIPAWKAPDEAHWFGTGPNGADLFELSRHAMATSVSAAVVAVSLGVALALLLTSLFVFDLKDGRFDWLGRAARAGGLVPGMAVLVLVTGIPGGSLLLAIAGIAGVVAFHVAPVLASWFQEGEEGFDLVAARILGLSRREIVLGRILPRVLRRLPGVFATLVPVAVLAEMSLSFLGFTGERLSVGLMVAQGQAYLIEAPWMAVYPGLLATGVVLALSLLGWRVSVALRTGPLPRVL